jgi:hypothetical protein
LQLKFEFLINNIVRNSLNMNKKGRALIAVVIMSVFGVVALVITTTPDVALAQDQNPPTTGKTTPNVTSTFGPNLPTTTSSSSASNTTSDKVGNLTK